jgi:hypothetical protein
VWLTSVVGAPTLFLIILFFRQYPPQINIAEFFSSGLLMYIALALLQLILSSLTWLVFSMIIGLVLLIPVNGLIKTVLIFLSGILLTIGSFVATILPFDFYNGQGDKEFVILMACNCFCIGFGVWFYKLKLPQPDPPFQNREII